MKICEFVTSLAAGGAENFVRQLSICAQRNGHDVTVLLLTHVCSDDLYQQKAILELKKCGVKVVSLELCLRPFHTLLLFIKAIKFFSKNDFDVVHSHFSREDILSVFCRFICFKHYRCISTLHSSKITRDGWQAKVRLFLHRHYLLSVFCGKEAFEANRKFLSHSIYIPNGVALPIPGAERCRVPADLTEVMSSHPLLLSVGRLEEPKCHIKQIEAMQKVVLTFPQCKLLICGDGAYRNFLRQAIEEKHLEKNVFLLGQRSDVPALLENADYFISSSIYEGLPISVLEALAYHLPALLSPIPPHQEIAAKVHGCLCAKDESADAFAELIVNCIKNRFRDTISSEVFVSDMQQFSIENCWHKYFNIYK